MLSAKNAIAQLGLASETNFSMARDTYNRRGMSNMQLNDGPHGAWAGACRTSSGAR